MKFLSNKKIAISLNLITLMVNAAFIFGGRAVEQFVIALFVLALITPIVSTCALAALPERHLYPLLFLKRKSLEEEAKIKKLLAEIAEHESAVKRHNN